MSTPTPDGHIPCCDHCGCGTPGGAWPERLGHDDTCRHGCNDDPTGARDGTLTGHQPAAPIHPQGHFPESCGCDYCTHPQWCGGPTHEHLDEAPLWPCPDTLAANSMTTPEEFFTAEADDWNAWALATHPEWFTNVPAPPADTSRKATP